MTNKTESFEWVAIKIPENYGKYFVNRQGEIAKATNIGSHKKKLKGTNHGKYKRVSLTLDSCIRLYLVHRLVAFTFLKNPKKHKVINHIDGDGKNNHVSNLEWCTVAHNNKHARDTGLARYRGRKGEEHHCAIFKEKDVIKLRKRYKNGERCCDLAREYKIKYSTMDVMLKGITWKHIKN